ncbi:transglutaminase domain protein [Geotalea daltonii FRC-32]|uniref:Transglutaminase domain protein n=1 Tax=Geotalea daltonii (strain DSM 22248 / JCM 15807 / FRC-32) TaxID=316067 RepID=B9LZV1_GEODF|nr:transglutaminase-like domain-containing protein [Geotalea daltonii]ACM18915.1 transglutaminase domain protein [Geotalea daltonii FRC-32]
MTIRRIIHVLLLIFSMMPSSVCLSAPIPRLQGPPLGERWFSISMNGERVGFAHTNVLETADGFELFSEGSVKLKVMAVSRESSSRENYRVGKDLALKSFQVEQTIDGSPMKVKGVVEGKAIKVVIESAGNMKNKSLKVKKKILPPPALNFYPPMQGAVPGKTYNVQMLDVEGIKVKGVEIKVIGQETLPGGVKALHVQNDLYPFVDNDIWLDLSGNTLKESVRDEMILTRAEDALTVQNFIADAAMARKDLILDFSLIKVEPPLSDPEKLQRMAATFSGFPPEFPLYRDARQQATREEDGTIAFKTTKALTVKNANGTQDQSALGTFLEATARIPVDNGEIAAKAKEIAAGEQDRLKIVEKLTRWMATEVKGLAMDSRPPLETMKIGEGNSQSHALLYVTMARAMGIPSRFVSGLAYIKGKGFLYHCWAESYLGEWLAVDPTFGQLPVNASHIKLVEGESPEQMALVGSIVGKLKARVIEQQY